MDELRASDFADHAEAYLAAWNERDIASIRGRLASCVNVEVIFSDPANRTVGIDALTAMIAHARAELPDAEYFQTSALDGGHDGRYRYTWSVRTVDGATIDGMDCVTVDDQNRFLRIDGFFGELTPRD